MALQVKTPSPNVPEAAFEAELAFDAEVVFDAEKLEKYLGILDTRSRKIIKLRYSGKTLDPTTMNTVSACSPYAPVSDKT